ncbi:LAGLIDADG family homing endonuclease [Halogeometricum sp. CBA1124]|uniref:LAGLIDADG family homing endonuclease n=1 Tax=Halogeometricum sp. CBA1124 TaxID=2668071 RepID=UPI00142A33C6|nr:LAGLIDADG family homing endonuclease [Halogeometricum sp. CBA1124]MUV57898.1 cell division protein [Halogeometricum sp. CBA1124]
MAQAPQDPDVDLTERFIQFYRKYYSDDIGRLAQRYPNEQRSLYVDYDDLFRFDEDLAEDYRKKPDQIREYAEEALRLYDLPVDVKLGRAHVRLRNLPDSVDIRNIRVHDDHIGRMVSVQGIVRKATDVRPKITEAAFECQRCGTMTYIPQTDSGFQEPHECQGCERQGPFHVDFDQSEFVDSQKLRVQESPEGLRGGETPQSIDIDVEDDVTGKVTAGDHVTVTGVLHIEQQTSGQEKTPIFDLYMDGVAIEIEDEEFEDMDISEEDVAEIVELSNEPDIYEKMVGSVAPSIYGYEQEKLAMILQLFSGVTKHLPDGSRIRGDLHMLLIGDPGTGKSAMLQYVRNIAPRSVYTSGKGSSSAGLTAAAVRDDFGDGQQWTLEAGALVLADKGIAAVDELDKMRPEDRSAMHEGLEQQSYHPESEILLSDGRRAPIGPFVDSLMDDRAEAVVDGVDCEILPVDDVGVHSVDLESNETEKIPVDRVSRHEAPDRFIRVTFSNGRSVLVTPEHPMFVDEDGDVETVAAEEVTEGAFVPAPRKLPNSAEPRSLAPEPHRTRERDVRLPESMSPALAELLGLLTAEGHSYAGSSHEIGFSNQDERLLDRVDRLMSKRFGLESTDVVGDCGTTTKRWISTKLYRWFESNFPEFMRPSTEKRIPEAVLGASEEEIRRFLVGAFAGDGSVESESMAFATSCRGLAEDYADALLKIGVASRIHYDEAEDSWKTYVMGDSTATFVDAVVDPADDRYERAEAFADRSTETKRHHDVLPTSAAEELRSIKRLLGVSLTGRFRETIDEGYGVRVETVRSEVEALRSRIETVRADLSSVATLADVRKAVGWSGRQLAERLDGVTTSTVHYAESGGYDDEKRRRLYDAAVESVRLALGEATDRLDELDARCDLRYYRVTDVETVPNDGEYECDWVYDVTVEPTNTFVSQGVVLHNSISISKAGINATLKSRCSLLGAANPKYGRFDQYESIGEQIDLEPALISRFDLIFTVTDSPDPETDAELAEHIINTNYAGELHTQRTKIANSEFTEDEVNSVTEEVAPEIDAELLRKYIAYAKRNCYPTMTDEAKEVIRDFYVNFRAKGSDEDSPVPVTARKLEALVRLAEASARVRLSDTVTEDDAVRVTNIVESCLRDIGMDPETGEFDADIVETGTSKNQRDRIKNLKQLISDIEDEYEEGAPVDEVVSRATTELNLDESKAEQEIENLRRKGEVYEPRTDHLRTT